MGKTTT